MNKAPLIGIVAFSVCVALSFGQMNTKSILHYGNITGGSHREMFNSITGKLDDIKGEPDQGFFVKHSQETDDILNLMDYDILLLNNNLTIVNVIPPGEPQEKFIEFMDNGGKLLAYHAACDHDAGKGGSSQWDYYNELFDGLDFLAHGVGWFTVVPDDEMMNHPGLSKMWEENSLGTSAEFDTESYEFLFSLNNETIRGQPGVVVMQTVLGSEWRDDHPLTWYKSVPGGGEMIYSALGHKDSEFDMSEGWLQTSMSAYLKYLGGVYEPTVGCKDDAANNYDATADEACFNDTCCTYDPIGVGQVAFIRSMVNITPEKISVLFPRDYSISVVNVTGETIIAESCHGSREFSLSGLPAGLYYAKVTSGAKSVSKRILVK